MKMYNKLTRLMRKRRGFRTDEGGVSEILGDILLVSVAIVVIGSIAAQVVDVQKPTGSKSTDFSARLEGNDLVITHMGGRTLQNQKTLILVGVGSIPARSLKIADGFTGPHPTWKISEEWRVNISSEKTYATSNGVALFVQIIDTGRNVILLDQVLISGKQILSFPDVGFQPGSLTFSSSRPNSGDPELITVKVVNYGTVNVDNLMVRFYDDTTLIGTNSSILLLNKTGSPGSIKTVTLNWVTSFLGRHVINAKVVPKLNETNLANNYISARLNVGFGVNLDFTKPNLVVTDFTISKERPLSKETTLLKATIANTAKIQATGFNLTWGDDFEGANKTLGTTTYVGNVTYVNNIVQTYVWVPQKGGLHHVWVHISAVKPNGEDSMAEADPVLDADWGLLDITVMPRILLVDDDMAGKGTAKDTTTYMKESLKAIGIQFDLVNVGAGDGPQYNGTGIVLDNYDLVIWMTGYESTNTLTTSGTTSDISNLKKYLDNKGSLWLLGQDVTDDLWNNGGVSGRAFLKDYLHVNAQTLNVKLGTAVHGNSACPPVKGMDFNTSVPSGLTASPDMITPDANSRAAMNNQTNQNISIVYNKTTYRMGFFAFEYSHIGSASQRAILTYKMLLWFNVTVFFDGDDLAVSEVTITPSTPHYKEEVTIKAVIRNNGVHNLNNVKVVFKDLYMGVETIITPNLKDRAGGKQVYDNPMNLNMTAMGGENLTVKYWVPEKIGMHQIMVEVDPNNVVSEIDETNNQFVSDLTTMNVYVDSITLIVDDDQANLGFKNTTSSLVTVLKSLNYKYVVWKVPNAASSGPDLANMSKYNNMIWCFGNESTVGSTFTTLDTTNLQTYLTGYQGNLWVIGQNFLEDNGVRNNLTFRQNLLGIQAMNRNIATPTTLLGVNNNITHGMRFPAVNTFGNSHEADAITPGAGAQNLFVNAGAQNFATAFQNSTGSNYKVVVMTFEYSFITDPKDQMELAYMIFHWFGQSDTRIELRITYDDLFFARDSGLPQPFDAVKPLLGSSYILQAKIWNVGNTPTGAIVRFLDGNTVIDSASIYVPASTTDSSGNMVLGSELAEVIWSPLFAGNRAVTIKVDPDQNIPVSTNPISTTGEVMKKNNNITRNIEVYFFYDDMENGPGIWAHDATILNINGEQPIEYLDRLRPIDTNVISDFDWTAGNTNNWTKDITNGHTIPSSYSMIEPFDINLTTQFNLKVAMCIDDSGSMTTSDPNDIRLTAANNFVKGILTRPGDQVAVYRFTSNLAAHYRNMEQFYGTGANYDVYPFTNTTTKYLKDTAGFGNGYFISSGNTPYYDCLNIAVSQQNAWGVANEYPVLIGLTDGQSNLGLTFAQYLPSARASKVPIYTIGLGAGVIAREMYDTAEVSNGGKYYYAADADVLNDTFQRIATDIGNGASRDLPEESSDIEVSSDMPSSRDAESGDAESRDVDSRNVDFVQILNPNGANNANARETWGKLINRNITWACHADTKANCANARIQISVNNGAWQDIASGVGTELFWPDLNGDQWATQYNWYSTATGQWYPRRTASANVCQNNDNCRRVYNYNWSVPNIVSNNVRIRISVTDNGNTQTSDSAQFAIFDQGIILGNNGKTAKVFNITTKEFRLSSYQKATLSFWQTYDLLYTENGGVVQIGTSIAQGGPYKYKYASPVQPYTGNLRIDKHVYDNYVNEIKWAWNGRSCGGTAGWEYQQVDLSPFISGARPWVKVRFSFYTWGFGNGGGWSIDDVKVAVQRNEATAITNTIADQWQYYQWTSGVDSPFLQPHSGTHMWWNHDPVSGDDTASGIDNSLYTRSIDLKNAKDASLSAYFKFNFNDQAGRPPNGFRVEVSSDNGVLWNPTNLGVRSAWGVSGQWSIDGKSPNGKQAYTGIQDSGVDSATPVWVEAGSLWRLNMNLSGYAGQVIKIRFRVVTNLDANHYKANTVFKGLAIDDVLIRGNSTISGAPMFRHDSSNDWLKPDEQVGHNGAQMEKSTKITAHDADMILALPAKQSKMDQGDM
jgi:hypothetical protein